MKKFGLVCALLASVGIGGCATLESGFESPRCSYEGGYRDGVNDARAKRREKAEVGGKCSDKDRLLVQKAYRDGYSAAGARMPASKR